MNNVDLCKYLIFNLMKALNSDLNVKFYDSEKVHSILGASRGRGHISMYGYRTEKPVCILYAIFSIGIEIFIDDEKIKKLAENFIDNNNINWYEKKFSKCINAEVFVKRNIKKRPMKKLFEYNEEEKYYTLKDNIKKEYISFINNERLDWYDKIELDINL